MKKGTLVISLDFEMLWGMRDHTPLESPYAQTIKKVPEVSEKLLSLFQKYHIHATWATVGLLMADQKEKWADQRSHLRPSYVNKALDSYCYLDEAKKEQAYYQCGSLLDTIKHTPGQEIGSHTFSHYYATEEGQTKEEFREDLERACEVALHHGIHLTSLVFPRNQFNENYRSVLQEKGITSYRGCQDGWMYDSHYNNNNFGRAIKLLDTYFPLTGNNSYKTDAATVGELPFNLKGSCFLRMYNRKLKAFEGLKIRRIRSEMKHAAKHGEVFHLWFHPHNVTVNPEKNLRLIEQILFYYQELHTKYRFESLTMDELSSILLKNK